MIYSDLCLIQKYTYDYVAWVTNKANHPVLHLWRQFTHVFVIVNIVHLGYLLQNLLGLKELMNNLFFVRFHELYRMQM